MSEVTKPIALDESLNTTESTPRNIADVLADELVISDLVTQAQAIVTKLQGIISAVKPNASDIPLDPIPGMSADDVQEGISELKGTLDELEKNDSSGSINIADYNSLNNRYTCQHDGYVVLNSNSGNSGYMRIAVYFPNGNYQMFKYLNVTQSWTIDTLFVKKGTQLYVAGNTVSGGTITFSPLDS